MTPKFENPISHSPLPAKIKFICDAQLITVVSEKIPGHALAYICKECDKIHLAVNTKDATLVAVVSLDEATAEMLARQLLAPETLPKHG